VSLPVAQDTSGQSDSTVHASKPRVMESPTAAIDVGLRSQVGVGFGNALAVVPRGAGELSPTASQPATATPRRAADARARAARER
jgi:hypothetical protein